MGIDWAGVALERATKLSLNGYLQKNIFEPLGIKNMSMIPSHDMRKKLAHMHARDMEGVIRPRNHLHRQALVIDPDNEAEVKQLLNSGGAGMFAKPQEYTRKSPCASPPL